jgi:guanosine-3',5'-bis(diphosphate) 3'-pyrophosphohydrolase
MREAATYIDHAMVLKAYEYASIKHINDFRADGVTPYIRHPMDVALTVDCAMMATMEMVAAAILHDVVEDTDATIEDIELFFGKRIAGYVKEVTYPADLPDRREYIIDNVKFLSDGARLIKLADITCNLRDIAESGWSAAKKDAYMSYLKRMRYALAGTDGWMEEMFDLTYDKIAKD